MCRFDELRTVGNIALLAKNEDLLIWLACVLPTLQKGKFPNKRKLFKHTSIILIIIKIMIISEMSIKTHTRREIGTALHCRILKHYALTYNRVCCLSLLFSHCGKYFRHDMSSTNHGLDLLIIDFLQEKSIYSQPEEIFHFACNICHRFKIIFIMKEEKNENIFQKYHICLNVSTINPRNSMAENEFPAI